MWSQSTVQHVSSSAKIGLKVKGDRLKVFQTLLSLVCFSLLAFNLQPSTALAQDAPLTLEQALTLAPNVDADVISARSDLASAERDLQRISSDPLALRLEKLQAEQQVASDQDTLNAALLTNRLDVTTAFFTALEADETLANAQKQLEIATATLQAQQVRYEAGAITQIDLSNAQNDAVEAERSVRDAENSCNLAYSDLSGQLGQPVTALAPYDTSPPGLAPLEDATVLALQTNLQLKSLQRSVDLAQTQLETTDNAFSARSDIDSAKDSLANAQLNLSDNQQTLPLTVENSYNSVLSAQASYDNALEAFQTSAEDLTAQKARLEAGSISPITFQQSELSYLQQQAALNTAKHQLVLAHIRLEQAVQGQTTTTEAQQ